MIQYKGENKNEYSLGEGIIHFPSLGTMPVRRDWSYLTHLYHLASLVDTVGARNMCETNKHLNGF